MRLALPLLLVFLAACDSGGEGSGEAPAPRSAISLTSDCPNPGPGVIYYTFSEEAINCATPAGLRRATPNGALFIGGELAPITRGSVVYNRSFGSATLRQISVAADYEAEAAISLTTYEYETAALVDAPDGRVLLTQFRDPVWRSPGTPIVAETFVVVDTTLTRLSAVPVGPGPSLTGVAGAYSSQRNATAVIYLVSGGGSTRRILEIDHDTESLRRIEPPPDVSIASVAYVEGDLLAMDNRAGRVYRVNDDRFDLLVDLGLEEDVFMFRPLYLDPAGGRAVTFDRTDDDTGTDLVTIYPDGRTERTPAFDFPAVSFFVGPDYICGRLNGSRSVQTGAPYEPEVFEALDRTTLTSVSRDTVRLDTLMLRQNAFGCF